MAGVGKWFGRRKVTMKKFKWGSATIVERREGRGEGENRNVQAQVNPLSVVVVWLYLVT